MAVWSGRNAHTGYGRGDDETQHVDGYVRGGGARHCGRDRAPGPWSGATKRRLDDRAPGRGARTPRRDRTTRLVECAHSTRDWSTADSGTTGQHAATAANRGSTEA